MPNPPKSDDTTSPAGRGKDPSHSGSSLDAREAAVLKQLAEVQDPYVGTLLSERYKIIKKLGAGGMGAVYLAEHVMIERRVAIKILSQDFAGKPDLVQRFIQEARAAARIGHENIVEVHDFGETASGSVFFTMEYLEGQDLAQILAQTGPLPVPRIKNIMGQLCRALAAAHAKGIVHRDLKPENIYLVEKEGKTDFVKILDFGIAKMTTMEAGKPQGGGNRLTQSGMIFGTAEYMSPEQARGEAPDHRVDIYALGCILYEMLTGRVPFHAETYMGTLTKHMFEAPEPPSYRNRNVSKELEAVCLHAMEKDRNRRFQTMTELVQAIEAETPLPPAAPPVTDPSMSFHPAGFPAAFPQSMGMGAPGYAPPMMMQPGPYGVPGPVQPMGMLGGGVVGGPMSMNSSGMVSGPMMMNSSGMISGPLLSGAHMQPAGFTQTAPPAYEVARPPTGGQFRRLIFIFAGAAIGVAVLALLLLWPQAADQNLPQTSNSSPMVAQRPDGPARLTVRGLPGSKVFVDFVEVGTISGIGELVHELTSPTGALDWSVSVRVAKPGFEEFVIRQTVRAGQTATLQSAQAPTAATRKTAPGKTAR